MRNKIFIRFLLAFLFVSTGTFFYWLLYKKPLIGIDDANIYFIYMRNLADGLGFVYNAGGERVEGFTSLLWTLVGSVFFLATPRPEIFLLFFNVLIIAVTIWQLIIFANEIFEDRKIFFFCIYFILGSILIIPGYFDWTILTLMETGWWSCLLITITITLCRFEFSFENHRRNNFIFSVLLILLVLCRPESFLWGVVFLSVRAWQLHHKSLRTKNIFFPLTCFAATALCITGWRLSYFGFPMPNTFYAKVSSNYFENFFAGLKYDYFFFKDNVFLLLIFCFGAIYFFNVLTKKTSDEKSRVAAVIFVTLTVALLIPIFTGGDHFMKARFIQPVVPLFYLLCAIIMVSVRNSSPVKIGTYPAVSLLLFAMLISPAYNLIDYVTNEGPIQNEFNIATSGRALGKKLTGFFNDSKPMPSVGLLLGGAEAFSYQGISVDLLGLNDTTVAHASRVKTGLKNHASFNKQAFYKLAPDIFSNIEFLNDTSNFVIIEKNPMYRTAWFGEIYKDIFTDEPFRKLYFPVFIFRRGEQNILHAYANEHFLNRLDTTYYSYCIIKK